MAQQLKSNAILDKMLGDMNAARESKPGAATQVVEDLLYNESVITPDDKARLAKRPEPITVIAVENVANETGIPLPRARELADEVSRGGQPALVVESYRAENQAKDAFAALYEEEVTRLRKCPLRVRVDGEWVSCGVPLRDIQQALVHHSVHLMYESRDDRVRRAITNDISEKLYPTEVTGVRAALTAEERTALFSDPKVRDRLLNRGRHGVLTDE